VRNHHATKPLTEGFVVAAGWFAVTKAKQNKKK
jgi:hypothetical protein